MASVKQIISVLIVSLGLVTVLLAIANYQRPPSELIKNESGEIEDFAGPFASELDVTVNLKPMDISNEKNPVAVFTTSAGVIELELFADQMPITVGNFTKLIEEGYYDGTKFHRVIDGFMIQGGDPNTKSNDTSSYGSGSPGYTIQDEFIEGDLLTNVRGTIAMANTGQPNSGGSQFFINTADNTNLDFDKPPMQSRHPVFGRVVAGMDIVNVISKTETGERDIPVTPIVIESVTLK